MNLYVITLVLVVYFRCDIRLIYLACMKFIVSLSKISSAPLSQESAYSVMCAAEPL